MKRFLAALFFLGSISFAHAQDALVVSACGLAPPPYTNVGAILPITVDTTGKLCSAGAGGGVTGSGVAGQVTFWNSSSTISGDVGFTYTVQGQATLALGTITTNNRALSITGTWNAAGTTFDAPLFMNITNTASAAASLLADFQVGGTSEVSFTPTGSINWGAGANIFTGSGSLSVWQNNGTNAIAVFSARAITARGIEVSASGNAGANDIDTQIQRQGAAGTFGIHAGTLTNAASLQVYNTSDVAFGTPTNYERGVFDWTTTANTLTIGTQNGGTGTGRNITFTAAGTQFAFNIPGSYSASHFVLINALSTSSQVVADAFTFDSINKDTALTRNGPAVSAFGGAGAVGDHSGYYQWGGQARVTADVTNATTTLATITGLSVNVLAGRTYCFIGELSWTDAAAGGLQLAVSGTSTATNIIYDGYIIDSAANGTKGNAQATALGGVVASAVTTGTAGHARLTGCDTVNAAGTLLLQFAENTSNATATTIKRGSYFYVYDSP